MSTYINTDYKIGLKREVVEALRTVFDSSFPWPDLKDRVNVTLEYPMEQIKYPAIYITYTEEELRNAGVSHIELDYESDALFPMGIKHWIFSGTLHFNAVALNPLDRDRLASALINAIAFGGVVPELNDFYKELYDAEYVAIQPLFDRIIPGGEQVGQVPWTSEDELQFSSTYSIKIFGEFWSNRQTLDLIQIKEVILYPYRLNDQDPPWD